MLLESNSLTIVRVENVDLYFSFNKSFFLTTTNPTLLLFYPRFGTRRNLNGWPSKRPLKKRKRRSNGSRRRGRMEKRNCNNLHNALQTASIKKTDLKFKITDLKRTKFCLKKI